MSNRTRLGSIAALLFVSLVIVDSMIWASSWPHNAGGTWVVAGLVHVVVCWIGAFAFVREEWLP